MQRQNSINLTNILKPLRRLSLRSKKKRNEDGQSIFCNISEQSDIVSMLPSELRLNVFLYLDFSDLFCAQKVCKSWYLITKDHTIWRKKYHELVPKQPDLPFPDLDDRNAWMRLYRGVLRDSYWDKGEVQTVRVLRGHIGSVFSVKMRDDLLVTAGEDNQVIVWDLRKMQCRNIYRFELPVRCVDVLPELDILAVAFYGSKCHIYDLTRPWADPIQILKGGNHPSFLPDSIAIDREYFVLAGRKPSAVFVWKWRKGVRVANRAFDSQMHSVYLSGDNVITVSCDGYFNIFNISHNTTRPTPFELPACELPCYAFDGLSMICASARSPRIFHFRWHAQLDESYTPAISTSSLALAIPQRSASASSLTTTPPSPHSPTTSTPLTRTSGVYRRKGSVDRTDPPSPTHNTLPVILPDLSRKPRFYISISGKPPLDSILCVALDARSGRAVASTAGGHITVYGLEGNRIVSINGSLNCEMLEMLKRPTRGYDEWEDHATRLAIDESRIVFGTASGNVCVFGFEPVMERQI